MSIKINTPIRTSAIFDKKRIDDVETDTTQVDDKEHSKGLNIDTDTLDKIADFAETKPTDFINRLGFEDLQKALPDLSPEELKALLNKLTPAELKQFLASLSAGDLKALLSQLDPAALKTLLASLKPADLIALLKQLDPADIENLNLADPKAVLDHLDPAALRKLIACLSSDNVKDLISLDHAQLTTALGQLKHQDLKALLGHLPPSMLRDAFNRLDETQFLDILTSSPDLAGHFAEQGEMTSEQLQQLMDEIKDTCTPEEQEVLEGLLSCQNEDDALEFADKHANVFMGAPGADSDPVYDSPDAGSPRFLFKNDSPLSNFASFTQGKGDITKLMIFLFMDMYDARSDILRRNAADLNSIKQNTKELTAWWDAVRSMGKTGASDFKSPPWSKAPPDPEEIFQNFEKLGVEAPFKDDASKKIRDAYKPLMDQIKGSPDFAEFVDNGTFKTLTKDQATSLIDKLNDHLNKLSHDLQCDGELKLFEKVAGNYEMPKDCAWGDKGEDFKKKASEANTIQQSAATLMNAESTNLQSLNNMQTKIMETRQAILQKITSM